MSKLVRVELELEDGTIMRLTGEDAEKWNDMVESQASMAYIHGARYASLPWTVLKVVEVKKEEPAEEVKLPDPKDSIVYVDNIEDNKVTWYLDTYTKD